MSEREIERILQEEQDETTVETAITRYLEEEDRKMTDTVKEVLRSVLVRNLRMYIKEGPEMGMEPEEIEELKGIMHRIANDTASEEDWIEAIDQMDAA